MNRTSLFQQTIYILNYVLKHNFSSQVHENTKTDTKNVLRHTCIISLFEQGPLTFSLIQKSVHGNKIYFFKHNLTDLYPEEFKNFINIQINSL